jgi:hypothetical protein
MASGTSNLPFISGLGRALVVLEEVTANTAAVQDLLRRFGWRAAVNDQQVSGLKAVLGFEAPLAQLRQLLAALEQDNPDYAAIAQGILQAAREIYSAVDNLSGASFSSLGFPFDQPGFAEEFVKGLTAKLVDDYLQASVPTLHGALFALGILDAEEEFPAEEGRLAFTRRSIHWDRISKAIADPPGLFAEVYGWNGDAFRHQRFLDALELLLDHAGVIAHQVRPAETIHLLYFAPANHASRAIRSLEVPLFHAASSDFEAIVETGLIVLPIPAKGDTTSVRPVGFTVIPMVRGTATPDMLDAESTVTMAVTGSFATDGAFRVDIRPDGVEASLDSALTAVEGGIAIQANPPEPWIVLGDADGSHLAVLAFSAAFELRGTVGDPEFIVAINAARPGGSAAPNLAVVLSFANSDGFLKKIFGSDQHRLELGLGVLWSSKHGLRLNGQAGFETRTPAHIEFGPVTVNEFAVSARAVSDPAKVVVGVGAGFNLKFGPLLATIDNVGVKLELQQRPPGEPAGTFGDLALDFGFKPPEGIGLVVDGGGFKGGGLLRFEPDAGRYTGFLELEFQNRIAIKAMGLLETKLPGGQDGFALLIVITSEFTPIQLGFGFTLNGVGGLLGLNRRADLERLRTGIRDNTLGSILFPQDIVENSARIISDLRQVFPAQEGRFLFGPMAKIGWGSPSIITLDLGLLIEVPHPVRLAILGVLKSILPREEAPVLRLQVNFLGEIDLEKGQLLFDASLYDSKLLAFALTGDMAIRLFWGADPNFLLTVGGFHPAYQPPPMRLPTLRRLALSLTDGDNPRLRLETYFAITSNTVQFGARVEVYARASSFNVYGFIAFDVLFQFSPFRFIADVSAMLALRVGSSAFASISLAFTLEGPTPWSVKGTASFKICWFFTLKVRFSKTWGEQAHEIAGDALVMPLLLAALNDPNNWIVEPPTGRHLLVSTREIVPAPGVAAAVIAQPYGVLTVSQKVVPLNLTIETFGSLRPADGNLFSISGLQLGENTTIPNPEPAKEHFAPAQFLNKSDADKLSDKSFERYDSGIRIVENGQLKTAYAAARQVRYELSYIDSQRDTLEPQADTKPVRPDASAFLAWAVQGATAHSDLSHARNRHPALAPEAVAVADEQFAVVFEGDLQVVEGAAGLTEAEAVARVRALQAADPVRHRRVQVVPAFELATVA